eukprot:COSAG01_NODE_28318_length_664_cov_0.522124_1_plen_83_part_00
MGKFLAADTGNAVAPKPDDLEPQQLRTLKTVWTPFDGLPALPKLHFPNRDIVFSDPSPFNLSLSSELVRITGSCPIYACFGV